GARGMTSATHPATSLPESRMSPSPRVHVWSLVFLSLALALAMPAGCGSPSSALAAPDAPPPSTIPTSPAGVFAITSSLDLPVPDVAMPVITTLRAATDGPDDPSRYLVDRMIATLPDGTVKTIAAQAAPYVAAYLNQRLNEIAPRFVPGIQAIADGLARIAGHLGTAEILQIDGSGAAIRTITGVRFELGAAPITVQFAEAGLADIAAGTHIVLDATGHVTIDDHAHGLPYGALLRLGLTRAVVPSVFATARDLAGALDALVDCDRLGALVAGWIGLGSPELYNAACRASMTVIASELDAHLAAIDDIALSLELGGTASGVDLDGDGTMDELRAGIWSGWLHGPASREPIAAASFTASKQSVAHAIAPARSATPR
ncbi:MAG TPA: hypothetical protein VHN14_31575, partial [Kofleriaceae bacterium]|nr:hypothetical protein [Kofleriaceae bacterium]